MLGRCLLLLALCGTAADGACVCQEQHLCNPLTTPPPAKEVYAFALQGRAGLPNSTVADQWRSFRWDLVTSVAWDVGANETVCWAHKHGVRVIIPVGAGLPTALYGPTATADTYYAVISNRTARREWVDNQLALVAEAGADGVVFDVEGAEDISNKSAAKFLTALVSELRAAGHRANPHFHISFTTPIYVGQDVLPNGYDFRALSKVVDFFVPMGCESPSPSPAPPTARRLCGLPLRTLQMT